ncbi:DUF4381 domain-containing protein [Dyella soli]|uniref:DUF4381 domain-containing protein n=1 Tax=Dyella soli TaxID=522319 RepID=A0A4R0YFG4_9GAMM|nr:DUF4381 domain-containing protein [Dyella soli]TCI06986.1 DUF4381 domain-containing protein [Dyella soli]
MIAPHAHSPAASIAQLKEIATRAPVSWAPQAPGWWVVAALLLLAALLVALVQWRKWWRNRYRRAAQAELAAIEGAVADPARRAQALDALPALVKRTVLTWAARPQVGPMSGDAWLGFLDRTLAGQDFSRGPGRHLERLAYGDGDIAHDELDALLALLHRWIDDHVPA